MKKRKKKKGNWSLKASSQNNAQAGFTLLEVLISMAIAATIGMAAYAMYANVLGATTHARKHLAGADERRAFFRIIANDLGKIFPGSEGNIQPFTLRSPSQNQISGDPFLQFTTTNRIAPSREPYHGLVYVEYSLKKSGNSYTLIRKERDYAGIAGDFKWKSYGLLRNIKKLDVQYWDNTGNQFAGTWNNQKNNNYPESLKFIVTFMRDDEEQSIIIPLTPKVIS